MKGDFSRFTHRKEKHYTRVLKQQGRVDLDADWNEYGAIQEHLDRTRTRDVIGPCGVPKVNGGFDINVDWWKTALLRAIRFTNDVKGWAVGEKGLILATANGATWAPQDSGTSTDLNEACFYDANGILGWTVGNDGIILATVDGGETWFPQCSGVKKNLYGVFFVDGSLGWAVGEEGTILTTSNGGKDWAAQSAGVESELRSVHFYDELHGCAVGAGGVILYTDDGGNTWAVKNSGTANNLNALFFATTSDGWIVGAGGTILATADGGINWASQTSGTAEELRAVFFASSTDGWAVGDNGEIRSTDDGGSTAWESQSSPTGEDLYGVHFYDASKGWAIGRVDTLLSTADGGVSWVQMAPIPEIDDFIIHSGRIFVDGILCELESDIRYLAQPDAYEFEPLNPGGQERTDLVYLDVWQRHITAIEDPSIRDVALGGPDTTTRVKTVWQVKIKKDIKVANGGTDDVEKCYEEIDGWPPSPGNGCLSTEVLPPVSEGNACQITPEAGYRGIENRLYRVEIHKSGGLDSNPAEFKWSRDNGSVVFEIEDFIESQPGVVTKVKVKRLGRDQILALHKDDWVEISDDATDLSESPAGTIAQIIEDPDETQRIITLSAPLTGFRLDRHPKIRRWDLNQATVPVSSESVELEKGVKVTFSGDDFRVGDYWVFAARAATGQIEKLVNEPPRGITHRYCKLALLKHSLGSIEVVDCRKKFRPLIELEPGCCTVVVRPGEDIQGALNSLPADGGCVCLKSGKHTIDDPIIMDKPNVVLHGEGPGTIVERGTGTNILTVSTVSDVRIEGVTFCLTDYIDDGLCPCIVVIEDSSQIHMRACSIGVSPPAVPASPIPTIIGIDIEASSRVRIDGNRISLVPIGICADNMSHGLFSGVGLKILNNCMTGSVQLVDQEVVPTGIYGIYITDDVMTECRVLGNGISEFATGISIGRMADNSIIAGNTIARSPGGAAGFAVETTASSSIIRDNYIDLRDPAYGGIHATGTYTVITTNFIASDVEYLAYTADAPTGILLGRDYPSSEMLPDHSITRGNVLTGFQNAIQVIAPETQAGIDDIAVIENRIEGVAMADALGSFADGYRSIGVHHAANVAVMSNHVIVSDLGIHIEKSQICSVNENMLSGGAGGVSVIDSSQVMIKENAISGCRNHGILIASSDTDQWFSTTHFQVVHNYVLECGFEPLIPEGFGGIVSFQIRNLTVESCEVIHTGASGTVGLNLCCVEGDSRVSNNRIIGLEDVEHPTEEQIPLILTCNDNFVDVRHGAQVVDNVFKGHGTYVVSVNLSTNDDAKAMVIIFSNNRCEHDTIEVGNPVATVQLITNVGHISVTGNHVRSDNQSYKSFDVQGTKITFLGNISSSNWNFAGAVLPLVPESFNHKNA